MKKYSFLEKSYMAHNERDFVEKLRMSSFKPEESIEEYMKQFSTRAWNLLNVRINHTSCEEFVSDLLTTGILSEYLLN